MSDAGLVVLGRQLRELRRQRGMTLRDLAAACDVHFSYLSKVEHGREPNPPSDAVLERLEAVLGDEAETLREARARWIAARLPDRVLKAAAYRWAAQRIAEDSEA